MQDTHGNKASDGISSGGIPIRNSDFKIIDAQSLEKEQHVERRYARYTCQVGNSLVLRPSMSKSSNEKRNRCRRAAKLRKQKATTRRFLRALEVAKSRG